MVEDSGRSGMAGRESVSLGVFHDFFSLFYSWNLTIFVVSMVFMGLSRDLIS